MEENNIDPTNNLNKADQKKEIPRRVELDIPGKKERILVMFVRVFRALLRFFERRVVSCRHRRLAKRMDNKR